MVTEPRRREKTERPERGKDLSLTLSDWLILAEKMFLPALTLLYFLIAPDTSSVPAKKILENMSLETPNGSVRMVSIKGVQEMLDAGPENLVTSLLKLGVWDLAFQIDFAKNDYQLQFINTNEVLGYVDVKTIGENIHFAFYKKTLGNFGLVNYEDFDFDALLESGEIELDLEPIPKALLFEP